MTVFFISEPGKTTGKMYKNLRYGNWGSHHGHYDDCVVLWHDAVYFSRHVQIYTALHPRSQQRLCRQADIANSLKLSIFNLILSVDTAFDCDSFLYTEVSAPELMASITGKRTELNTEARKLYTIFAMFGISMLKDMGNPKWRYETRWLLSNCAQRTSWRRRPLSEQLAATDAKNLTTRYGTSIDFQCHVFSAVRALKRSTRLRDSVYPRQVALDHFLMPNLIHDISYHGGLGFRSW